MAFVDGSKSQVADATTLISIILRCRSDSDIDWVLPSACWASPSPQTSVASARPWKARHEPGQTWPDLARKSPARLLLLKAPLLSLIAAVLTPARQKSLAYLTESLQRRRLLTWVS
jgi:hypothetical protein